MKTTIEAGGFLNALHATMRRAAPTSRPEMARVAARVLASAAESALAQMGLPGVLAYCDYLAGWWGPSVQRVTRHPAVDTQPSPQSEDATPDRERS